MSEKVVLYHNPRCSKSRQTLALLKENGIEPEIVEYLKTPPSAQEIEQLLEKLGVEPHDLLRTQEAPYKERKLSPASSKDEILHAIRGNPILLQRPIVVRGRRAVFGRPPENALALI